MKKLLNHFKAFSNGAVILSLGLPACFIGYAYGIIKAGFIVGEDAYEKFRSGD